MDACLGFDQGDHSKSPVKEIKGDQKLKRLHIAIALIAALALATFSAATARAEKLKVVTTLPHLAYFARQLGGGMVEAVSLAHPQQDPHFVSPKPTLMKACRDAVAFVEEGLQLEPWADAVANGSGNSRIMRGQPGRIIASAGARVLDLPSVVSREWGDIHPYGNPHVWLDPLNAKQEIDNIAAGLARVYPAGAQVFEANRVALRARIDNALFGPELVKLVGSQKLTRLAFDGQLYNFLAHDSHKGKPLTAYLGGWLKECQPLRGRKIIAYHKSWIYFGDRFGLWIRGEVEEKPGIPPGPRHQRHLIDLMRNERIRTILMENFYDRTVPNYVARETGASLVVVPLEVGGADGVDTYFDLISTILTRLRGS